MQRHELVIPRPVSVKPADGSFVIRPDTIVAADEAATPQANLLVQQLEPALGRKLKIASPTPQDNCIALSIDPSLSALGDEGYRLHVTPRRAEVIAPRSAGVLWGIQTIRQLLPTQIFSTQSVQGVAWDIPCGDVEDQPRFIWRGLMLDCARHFMPIGFLYTWVDLLSLHKMRVFHWHLTDDQGWRIEIKEYPKLTEVGAWRSETLVGHGRQGSEAKFDGVRHGGFYSQDEIRRLVRYAADRNVTIVPEIEMPGHSQAAIAAYPELGNHPDQQQEVWTRWGVNHNTLNVEDSTVKFYQDVLSEVLDLFPSQFIHVGGDEAPKEQWKQSPRAQELMKQRGLQSEDELQSWFIRQMDKFLADHGRRLIGWDEILEGGLAPGAAVMSWRGEEGGVHASRAGHDVVMAPSQRVYFDHYQSRDHSKEPLAIGGFTPIDQVYLYEPIPAELNETEARHVLGSQAQLWSEYILDPRHAEYMAYPRACALAEVVWSPKANRDFAQFRPRLEQHLERLKLLGVNYRPLD